MTSQPYSALNLMSMSQTTYSYSITGFRFTPKGNIGPALINIKESMEDNDYDWKYHGYDLHDTNEEFVFLKSISWHFSSTRAIWMESLRGNVDNSRIRMVKLNKEDFPPGNPIECTKETPDDIPFAYDLSVLNNLTLAIPSCKIDSKIKDGVYIFYSNNNMIKCSLEYIDYIPDGVHYYKGNKSYKLDIQSRDSTYTANEFIFYN